jgi:hypothetical protein
VLAGAADEHHDLRALGDLGGGTHRVHVHLVGVAVCGDGQLLAVDGEDGAAAEVGQALRVAGQEGGAERVHDERRVQVRRERCDQAVGVLGVDEPGSDQQGVRPGGVGGQPVGGGDVDAAAGVLGEQRDQGLRHRDGQRRGARAGGGDLELARAGAQGGLAGERDRTGGACGPADHQEVAAGLLARAGLGELPVAQGGGGDDGRLRRAHAGRFPGALRG